MILFIVYSITRFAIEIISRLFSFVISNELDTESQYNIIPKLVHSHIDLRTEVYNRSDVNNKNGDNVEKMKLKDVNELN